MWESCIIINYCTSCIYSPYFFKNGIVLLLLGDEWPDLAAVGPVNGGGIGVVALLVIQDLLLFGFSVFVLILSRPVSILFSSLSQVFLKSLESLSKLIFLVCFNAKNSFITAMFCSANIFKMKSLVFLGETPLVHPGAPQICAHTL